MLQSIHDNAKGWIAYAIVGLISVPFALWGIQEYIGGNNKNIVAVVNGEDIELQAVQNEVAQQRQRIAQMFGKIPPGFDEKTMRKSALESLIDQTLLKQHAKEQGYRASNQEVFDLIKTIPQFQKDGAFDKDTYHSVMASQGRSAASFEQQLRNSLSDDQFRNAIADTAFLAKSEMELYQSLSQQKRDIEVYTLKVEDVMKDIVVSDEMIKVEYDKNPQAYQTDEMAKIAYVELKKADISKTIEVTDELLQAYYEENAGNYSEKPKFKMSHIKVNVSDAQNEEQAEAKANALYSEISSGSASFEDVAARTGDDTLFVELGEAIGFLDKGSKDPAMALIEEAVFAAKAGDVIEPVKTPAGYEIIKVLDLVEGKQKTFAGAKDQVKKEYINDKTSTRYEDLFELLRTSSFENDGSLEPAASAVGAEIKTSDFFSRKGGNDPITTNPNIISATFSPEVLSQGLNSAVIELSGSHAIVLRSDGHKSPELKTLADVHDQIAEKLKKQLASEKVKEQGDKLLAAVKASGNWSTVSDASTIVKYAAISRNDDKVPPHITSKTFQMSLPKADKATYANVNDRKGDYSIIALTAVNDGDVKIDEVSASEYSSYIGNRLQVATLKALREKAEVEVNARQLDAE